MIFKLIFEYIFEIAHSLSSFVARFVLTKLISPCVCFNRTQEINLINLRHEITSTVYRASQRF